MSEIRPVLWHTKFHRPRVTPTLIRRPRLLEQLNRGLHHQLILICAPAGFGKTTLVSSWIEAMGTGDQGGATALPATWLSLEESESDLIAFVRYLITAMRAIFEDSCPETFEMLHGSRRPRSKHIAASLSNEIDRLPGHFLLILDDFHTIRGKGVPNLLNRLLLHWPEPLHLALISRTNPPLQLAKLRTGDQLTEIRSRDLRFQREESVRFLSNMLQMAPSDPLMDQLEERMEGWIGALRLAALSLRSRSNMPEKLALFERSEDTLVEYLVHDVLLQQFPVIQNFLLRTSILDRFCASLCEALLGEIDPAWSIPGCINWLEREELFIIPLDHRGEWYRLHHLLRDVLRTRLAFTVAPEQVRALHQQASIWLEHQGLEDEAMKHALLAEDRELVVGLIERGLRDVLNRSERTTLDRWLRQLPEELVRTRPWLLMIRAWTLHFSWQLPELSDCLDDVEALITVDGGQTLNESRLRLLRAQVAALRAQHAYFSNHAADAIAYARVALETAPASWTFLQGGGAFYTALGMQAGGDGPAAERWLLDRYAPLEDKTSAYGLRLLLALCLIHLNQGAFEKLRQSATILLQQAVLGGAPLIRGWAHYLLGVAHFQWNELDIAVDYFERAVGNGYLTHELPLQNGRYGLALIYQARGSSSEAEETLERAANADIMRVGYVEESTLSMQARLALQQGKLDSAYRWADTFTEPPPDKALLWLETPHLTRARILLSRGSGEDIQKAMSTLNALLEIAERTHNVNKRWEILAVRALALDVQGHDQAAQADLWQAIGLAQAGHATQYFVDLGAPLQQLLRRALKQLPDMMHNGYTGGSVHRILAAFPREEEPAANNSSPAAVPDRGAFRYPLLAGTLTRRESQVLLQLRDPLSIKEIARRQGLSYATVKRHSINIYSKLGVNNRWDAVALAIELGLIPER